MPLVHENLCAFVIVFRLILLRMRSILDKSCRESHNTPFVFNNPLLRKYNDVCEIMWEKYGRVTPATDDNIWRMRISCRITKATYTHSEYAKLFALKTPLC